MKKIVVITVPIHRPLEAVEFNSLSHSLTIENSTPVKLVGPCYLKTYLERLALKLSSCSEYELGVKVFPNKYFRSVKTYNLLLKKSLFYRSFNNFEYMLLLQPDAILLKKQLSQWCSKGFSYVGAPVFRGYDQPTKPYEFIGVFNGGLSLRCIPNAISTISQTIFLDEKIFDIKFTLGIIRRLNRFLSIISNKRFSLMPMQANEDIFWSREAGKININFKVPNYEQSTGFSIETCVHEMVQKNNGCLPFGSHAWRKYDENFWIQNVPELRKIYENN